MKTITANGVELMLVEVPEDAYDFEVSQHPLTDTELIYQMPVDEKSQGKDDGGSVTYLEKYDHNKAYHILGTITNGVVDFDVEGLVKSIPYNGSTMYKNYLFKETDTYICDIAERSFLSLLAANGITGKKIVVLKISK